MHPVGSNGASQAIVDARVLGSAFIEHGVGRAALRAYEATLHDEMSALVLWTRGAGSVHPAGDAEPLRRPVFDGGDIGSDDVESFVAAYRTTSRLDVDELNRTPPTIVPGDRVGHR
jgi:hypothetical protein